LAQNLRYKGWSTPTVPSYGLLTAPASVRCLSEDAAKILIQAFINTRLDYCNSLYFGIADGLMSRLSERRRTSHHRSQAVRAHHTSPTSAALAASPRQTSGFQDINPCPSLVGWHRSCVPSWRMYAGYRRWPPSSAVCWQSNMLGQEVTRPVRWPLFCNCRANTMEQSAWTASATGHHLRTTQTIV